MVFALLLLEDTSVVEFEACTCRVREACGVVRRVVVGDDDLHSTWV